MSDKALAVLAITILKILNYLIGVYSLRLFSIGIFLLCTNMFCLDKRIYSGYRSSAWGYRHLNNISCPGFILAPWDFQFVRVAS